MQAIESPHLVPSHRVKSEPGLRPSLAKKYISIQLGEGNGCVKPTLVCAAVANMVWFQCEDCGENLKKPKLASHFRGCAAHKLSCIDCGVIFTQQSVQGHTQCVSEAEKYGPKNVGFIKKQTIKTSGQESYHDGLDLSLGLSTRSPWSCSICNVKATSQETLLLHSQGKKHNSKVRSMSLKLPNSKDGVARVSTAEGDRTTVSSNRSGDESFDKSELENGLRKDSSQVDDEDRQPTGAIHADRPETNTTLTSGSKEQKKEKERELSRDQDRLSSGETTEARSVMKEGEALLKSIGEKVTKAGHRGSNKHMNGQLKRKWEHDIVHENVDVTWSSLVKWKKLIKRALKNAPDGSLKLKQLRRSILRPAMKVVKNSGLNVNKESFSRELERQIRSGAKFMMEGKVVRLVV